MSEGVRRALCIGVGTFTPASAGDVDEPELTRFESLDFAVEYTRDLHAALEAAGYDAGFLVDPADLGEKQLGEHVDRHLAGEGVGVVHVLSHGDHTPDGGVYVVGADGARSKRTRVEDWRIAVADDPAAPMTLFLLDLCHAGAAVRHWKPPPAGAREKAWVIAAASANEPAYAGRFTRAATTVIQAITSGELDLAPTVRMVGFDVLYERIRKEVDVLRLAEGGYPQHLTATPVVGAHPELPFFPNPGYRPNPAAEAAAAADPSTAPFVDPILDEEHFRDRATGQGPAAGRITAGCFTGRAPQLRALSAWLDGEGDGGVRVVTGSPGAGKSALLGVLVCAAHPDLRGATRDLWRGAAARPSENPELAAVHARHRALPVILRSLTTQLHLVTDLPDGDLPDGDLTAAAVVGAITGRPTPPVVVVDAVDETLNPSQLVDQLLIPLARARRADGTPACRLLVGMRPWSEFAPLLDLARDIGEVLDLDAIPVDQRRADVADYVAALLELLPRYATAPYSGWRRAFTQAVAATLVRDSPRAPADSHEDGAEPRWGEFLVAALYTHTITLTFPEPPGDATEAARLGSAVPCTLPEVLELDLAARPPSRWRRPVLTALAHARGAGIPRNVLATVTGEVHGERSTPSVAESADEIDALRFYLRTGADTDGSTLYRFFHQGLADHLRVGPDRDPAGVAGQVLDGLLTTVPVERGSRRWDLAAPYLLRHAVQHATDARRVDEFLVDPGLLVHADPATLTPTLRLAHSEPARLAAAVYRTSAGEHADRSPDQRRDVLAIDAARYGAHALRDGLTSSAGTGPARWQPRWATGGQVSSALLNTIACSSPVTAVACTVLDGRPVAVTGDGSNTLRVWDLGTGTAIGGPLTGHTGWVTAVACTRLNDRPLAVTGSADRTIRIWDLITRTQIGNPLTGHMAPVAAIACTRLDGRPIAVTGGRDDTVRIWDLTTATPIGEPLTGHSGSVPAVACTDLAGWPVAVSATASVYGEARIWDLTTATPIGEPLTGHSGPVPAVACTDLAGRPVAVTGSWDGTIRVWELTGAAIGEPLVGPADEVRALACTVLDGHPIAITGSLSGAVRVWNLTLGTQLGEALAGHTDEVASVACAVVDDQPTAVTGGWDSAVRIWDLTTTATPTGNPLTGHTSAIRAVACTMLNGRPVAVTGGKDHTVRIWDPATATQIGQPLTGHGRRIRAVACTLLDERPVAVSGSADDTVLIWDLITGTRIGEPLTDQRDVRAVSCTRLHGRPVAVIAGGDGKLQVWDLTTGSPIGAPLTGHTNRLGAVACIQRNGRPIAVTGSWDSTVEVWDLSIEDSIGHPLTGHTGRVEAVACTYLDGRPVAVTSGSDATVRIWDLTTGTTIGDPLTGHTGTVWTVTCSLMDGLPVAVTGSDDSTVRVWDLETRRQVDRIDLPSGAGALDVTATGEIVTAFGWDIVVLERTPEVRP